MFAAIQLDLITGFLSFFFTLLILSYLLGDNPAFRLAIHAFVGVSTGYIVVVILKQVIADKLFPIFVSTSIPERVLLAIPFILGILLLGKTSERFEWLGRPVVALLVGIGTASTIAGAILGTLIPQILAISGLFGMGGSLTFGSFAGTFITAGFVLIGTITTLVYFQFSVFGKNKTAGKRGWLLNIIALTGQGFISITLGAIFAGVLISSLTALVDRAQSMVLFIDHLLSLIF